MKLTLLLQKNAWFIEHDYSLYCIPDTEQVNLAASALPLAVVSEDSMVKQPHIAGVAHLKSENTVRESRLISRIREGAAIRVTLTEPDGSIVNNQRVLLDTDVLSSVDWMTHPFRDGWMSASTSLVLDGIRRFELQAYLPAFKDSTGKTLIIHDETNNSSREVWLERDKNNVVPLFSGETGNRVVLRLECEPEAIDSDTDRRPLGFVIAGETAEAA